MDNFLARCSVLAIIGGGFVATGDLADVVRRGQRLVEAVDVPSAPADTGPVSAGVPHPLPGVAPRTMPQPSPADAAETPQAAPAPVSGPPDDGRQPVDHRPPANGPDRIDVTGLQAGDRITIWLRTAAIGAPLRLVCDVIDPRVCEVLVNGGTAGPHARGTILTGDGRPTNALVRGGAVRLQRIGPARTPATDLLVEGTIVGLARGD